MCDPTRGSSATLPVPGVICDPTPRILWRGQHFLPLSRVICDPTWPQCAESYGFLRYSRPPSGLNLWEAPTPLERLPHPVPQAAGKASVPGASARRAFGAAWGEKPFWKVSFSAKHSFFSTTRWRYPWRPQPCPTGVASTRGATRSRRPDRVTSSRLKFQVKRL